MNVLKMEIFKNRSDTFSYGSAYKCMQRAGLDDFYYSLTNLWLYSSHLIKGIGFHIEVFHRDILESLPCQNEMTQLLT